MNTLKPIDIVKFPFQLAWRVVTLILGGILWVIQSVSQVLTHACAKLPTTKWFEKHAANLIAAPEVAQFGATMTTRLDAAFAKVPGHLERGDLPAAANDRYPPAKFPELYEDIPDDIRRSVIVDGRVCTGEMLTVLAPRRLSNDIAARLYQINLLRQARLFSVGIVLAIAGAVYHGYAVSGAEINRLNQSQGQSEKFTVASIPKAAVIARSDIWNEKERESVATKIIEDQRSGRAWLARFGYAAIVVASIVRSAWYVLIFAGIAYLYCLIRSVSPRAIRGAIQRILEIDDGLLRETQESVVRWKKRLEKRLNEVNAYRKQIIGAKSDTSPAIFLGLGTGTMLFRGALSGYQPSQPVRLTLNDLSMHMAVTGTTGSGKSASVLVPLMRQVIQSEPKDQTIALLVLDGKGVLHHDAAKIAEADNRPIRVVGCKTGQFGVDLFDGVEPQIVAGAINDVMNQLSGSATSDPYWRQMAALILANAAVVARAYEYTPAGRKNVASTGERWYSPLGIYRISLSARSDSGAAKNAVDEIYRLLDANGPELAPIKQYLGPEVESAIDFLRDDCRQFPDQTWGSFVAQITQALSGFANEPLRSAFGVGGTSRLDIESIWNHHVITAVDLSPLEYGEAARAAAMLFKARVFAHGHRRYLNDPSVGKTSRLVIVMDEAHLLISSGSALSEDNYASICRAFGVSLVLSFQTLSTLYCAFGESSDGQRAKTLMDNLRTKVFLSSEGLETASYIRDLAGKTLRFSVNDLDRYESYMARRFEAEDFKVDDNISPLELDDAKLLSVLEGDKPEIVGVSVRKSHDQDMQFYDYDFANRGFLWTQETPPVDMVEKMRAIVWRAEDKRFEHMSHGQLEEDLVHSDEALTFGRGLMLAFVQRAGHVRMDIVNTDSVYQKFAL